MGSGIRNSTSLPPACSSGNLHQIWCSFPGYLSKRLIGVRAFACVSRRCRTLASEYSSCKPLRVNFTDSELSHPLPVTVLLSANQNFKMLKIHSEFYIADDDGERELEYISIGAALNANSFDCIEFLLERINLYSIYGVIDLFHAMSRNSH